MIRTHRVALPLFASLFLVQCGNNELSKNEQMSRDSAIKELSELSERASAAAAVASPAAAL